VDETNSCAKPVLNVPMGTYVRYNGYAIGIGVPGLGKVPRQNVPRRTHLQCSDGNISSFRAGLSSSPLRLLNFGDALTFPQDCHAIACMFRWEHNAPDAMFLQWEHLANVPTGTLMGVCLISFGRDRMKCSNGNIFELNSTFGYVIAIFPTLPAICQSIP
jgi:hypothetical protein